MSRKLRPFYIGALAVLGVGLLGSSLMPQAHADAWDKKTIVTVNEPIIAGNKVLDPGTYVWKLVDSQSSRHVVQIFDKDEQHLEETIIAVPNYRVQPAGKTQFSFWETPAGVPKAVRAWFYPGDNYGQEFAYPKKLVAEMASAAPVPVPVNYREPEPEPAPVAQPTPDPDPAPQVDPAPPEQAQVAPPGAMPVAPQPQMLPHTASLSPIVGLLGAVSLSLAGLVSLATRRA